MCVCVCFFTDGTFLFNFFHCKTRTTIGVQILFVVVVVDVVGLVVVMGGWVDGWSE